MARSRGPKQQRWVRSAGVDCGRGIKLGHDGKMWIAWVTLMVMTNCALIGKLWVAPKALYHMRGLFGKRWPRRPVPITSKGE
eukprot:scaffold143273_cov17-Tisochrysis_lutea.AAC.2